jgi:hypothetical protein
MGEAAWAYVVEHFDREKQAKDFVSLLRRLAIGRKTGEAGSVQPWGH